jgi:hypothetical protein
LVKIKLILSSLDLLGPGLIVIASYCNIQRQPTWTLPEPWKSVILVTSAFVLSDVRKLESKIRLNWYL